MNGALSHLSYETPAAVPGLTGARRLSSGAGRKPGAWMSHPLWSSQGPGTPPSGGCSHGREELNPLVSGLEAGPLPQLARMQLSVPEYVEGRLPNVR